MERRSLVLVTVDCLRADRLGFRGYSRSLTPFLDLLAKESCVFSDAVMAGVPTYFSFPAIMASRYPLSLGREILGIAPGETNIASLLQKRGYETAAFVAGNPYLSKRFGYDQGFRHFSDFLDARLSGETPHSSSSAGDGWSRLNRQLERLLRRTKITAGLYNELYFRYCQWRSSRKDLSMDQLRRYPGADLVVDAAGAWLKELTGQSFFLWVHLMDPHHPYYPPKEALEALGLSHITPKHARFLNSSWNRGDLSPKRLQRYRKEVMALYDAGVHWVDQQLSRLVDTLKTLHRWTETLFIVTADHGEEFLEHGNRYHSATGLAESLIRVPLLLRAPGVAARVVRERFSLIDLAPTMLEAAGVDVPLSFKGRGLWKDVSSGTVANHPAIVECVEASDNQLSVADRRRNRIMAVLDGDYKLVLRFREQSADLFDLKHDPEGMRPLGSTDQPKVRARLLQCARDHLRDSRAHRDANLALRARLREIRQRIDLKSSPAGASEGQNAVEIREHG